MKLISILGAVLLLWSALIVGVGSGLKYDIGGKGEPFGGDGYHGTHSVQLDYDQKIRYVRIDITDPIPFDELDDLSIAIKPLTECGFIYIELWFDGDGDGKWKSKSERDLKLFTSRLSISDLGLVVNEWTDLNAMDLEYGESRARDPKFDLQDWMDDTENLNLIRLYVRFDTTSKTYPTIGSIWLFDYFRINGMVASFEPDEGPTEKTGKPSRISEGGKITYTITYGNDLMTNLTNFVIVEYYDSRMSLISADPARTLGPTTSGR